MAYGADDAALWEVGKYVPQTLAPSAASAATAGATGAATAGGTGAMSAFSSMAPMLPLLPLALVLSQMFGNKANLKAENEQDAQRITQQNNAWMAQDNQVRNGWQQQAKVDFDNLIKSDPQIVNSINSMPKDQSNILLQNLYNQVEARTHKQWEVDHSRQDSGPIPTWKSAPGSRGWIDSPDYAEYSVGINDILNQLKGQPTQTYTTAGQDIQLNPSQGGTQQMPGAVGGTQPATAIQGSGTTPAQSQNWLQSLMDMITGKGGQALGVGGIAGAGLNQIGQAASNLMGGNPTPINQIGGSMSVFGNQQPGGQPPTGMNTGDPNRQNVQLNPQNNDFMTQLMSMFSGDNGVFQNPAAGLAGLGTLGLGSALNKDVKLPDFWEDRGVKALDAWTNTANHPMDPNVDAAIQRSMDIQNEQQLRNLRDVYKNARPGGDYLNDSAYQRDLSNLNRSMAMNTADAKAGSQLQSNAQNIGIMSNLAEGSVGQGRVQGLLDTQKQTNQNKLFGDLGSAFLQKGMGTTNVMNNFGQK